jgi:uncharacterized membrane protein YfcA
VSAPELAIALIAVCAGALVQGSIGFGLSLISVPAISLIEPGALPASILVLALPMTVWMALRERGHIDVRGFLQITFGRLFGTAAGVWVVASVSESRLSVVIGAAIVVAVGLSVLAPQFEAGNRTRVVAGVFSGLMGTAAAVGGPALALAYQKHPGSVLRSTLAVSFVAGSVVSLAALAIAGQVEGDDVLIAVSLVPGLAAGLFLADRWRGRLDAGWLRPTVLSFAAIAGTAAIVKGLL